MRDKVVEREADRNRRSVCFAHARASPASPRLRTGKRDEGDLRAGTSKRGAGVCERRSGCRDVIDKKYVCFARMPIVGNTECSRDIREAFLPRELRLLTRRPCAHEDLGSKCRERAVAEFLRQRFQDNLYLIKAALASTQAMQRHRHDEYRVPVERPRRRYFFAEEIGEELCRKSRRVPRAVVLEAPYKVLHFALSVIHQCRDADAEQVVHRRDKGDVFRGAQLGTCRALPHRQDGVEDVLKKVPQNAHGSIFTRAPLEINSACRRST